MFGRFCHQFYRGDNFCNFLPACHMKMGSTPFSYITVLKLQAKSFLTELLPLQVYPVTSTTTFSLPRLNVKKPECLKKNGNIILTYDMI